MLPCYHAKTRNVFLCLSIDSHLQWTTPVVVARALSDSKHTRMHLAHPLPFIMNLLNLLNRVRRNRV